MITRFSASAWSTALIDFSRETESGTMMNGKMTRSFSGSTGRTSGILIASSFAVSFASVIRTSWGEPAGNPCNRCSRDLLLQLMQFLYERLHILEPTVDGSESDVGNRIELAQPLHHHHSELLAADLALAGIVH